MNLGGHILSTALFHSDVLLTQLTLKRYCCSSLPHHPQAPLRMPVLLGATKWLLDPIDEKGKRKERERGIVTLFLICNMSQHLLATLCLLPLVHNVSSCLYFRNFLHNVSSSMILFSFFGDSNSGLVASPQSSLCVNVFRIYLEIISSHFLCLFDLYSQALFLCFYPHSLITSLLLFWFLWFFFSLYLFSEFCKCARLFSLVFWPFLLWDYIFILFILPYWVYFFVKSLKVMATCSVKIFTCFLANRWFLVAGKFCSNFLSFFFFPSFELMLAAFELPLLTYLLEFVSRNKVLLMFFSCYLLLGCFTFLKEVSLLSSLTTMHVCMLSCSDSIWSHRL